MIEKGNKPGELKLWVTKPVLIKPSREGRLGEKTQRSKVVILASVFVSGRPLKNQILSTDENTKKETSMWTMQEIRTQPSNMQGGSTGILQSSQDVTVHRKQMTNGERWEIYHALLARSINGKLKEYHTTEVSNLFSVPLQTVQKIWRRAKNTPNGEAVDVSHKRKGNCGRKKTHVDLSRIVDVPLCRRKTLRSLTASLDVSCTSLFRCLKDGLIKRHTNAIKPSLTENTMRVRLEFCISMLDRSTMPDHPKFNAMQDVVHIDEKCIYMTKKTVLLSSSR
ncbi:uncharacterized protein LOC108832853 [Raphanus sativus]|uniref:Uncharacterized protein LOC108832853 n=1 Tax=Raphanus sativus TaxID=3726 RepID=A0A6J0LNI5_RAPSA|nr:uncharacterized protein LOC108832853 [Raphanus sativus]